MSEDDETLKVIKEALGNMHVDDQVRVRNLADKMRGLINDNGEHGMMALALVGAEYASDHAAENKGATRQ